MRKARTLLTALAALAALTACGGGGGDGQDSQASATSSSGLSAEEKQFLTDARGEQLLGEYLDADLLAVGRSACENPDDATLGGAPAGDGTVEFEGAEEPVLAVDMITVEFSAREFLCP